MHCFAQADGGSVAMTSNKNAFFGADSFKDVVALPGFSVVAPTGMVASWGVAYAGVSGISRAVYSSQVDGAASAGFGFGNAQEFIGGSIDLGIGSINPTDGDAMSRGNIGITLGHFLLMPCLACLLVPRISPAGIMTVKIPTLLTTLQLPRYYLTMLLRLC